MAARMCNRVRLRLMRSSNCLTELPLLKGTCTRSLRTQKSRRPYLMELFRRREELGPDPERHPSAYGIWNYDAEIFAFGKRLGEEFNEEILKQAFILRSYAEEEAAARKVLLEDEDVEPVGEDNEHLAQKGIDLASRYVRAYLRAMYPQMFEEGISAVHDYLLCDEMLVYIGSQLGLRDLIMTVEYPPSDAHLGLTLKALIGALADSQDVARAEVFVRDFVITQLVAEDVNEIWDIVNPMGVLTTILSNLDMAPPEPRLLWKSGVATVMSVYHVGIYSNKKLIGKAPGETVLIAEEMAARDALKKMMRTHNSRSPLKFREAAEKLHIDYDSKNISVDELLSGSVTLQKLQQLSID